MDGFSAGLAKVTMVAFNVVKKPHTHYCRSTFFMRQEHPTTITVFRK
jgi:hypothetical protein